MKRFMNSLSDGNPRLLLAPILQNLAAGLFRSLPLMLVIMAIYEFIRPLQKGQPPLNLVYIGWITVGIIAALGMQYYFVYKGNVTASIVSFAIGREGRLQFGEHLRKLSLGFFKTRDRGEVASLLLQDFSRKEQIIYNLIPNITGAIALPILIAVVLVFQDWRLALALVSVIPLAGILIYAALQVLSKIGSRMNKSANVASNLLLDYLDGMKAIKLYGRAGSSFKALQAAMQETKLQSIRAEMLAVPLILLSNIVVQSGFILVLLLGSYYFVGGSLSLSVFILFLILSTRFYEPFLQLLMDVTLIRYFQLSMKRIDEVKQLPILSGHLPFPVGKHDIRFEHVGFSYGEQPTLSDITFQVSAGSVTALVGPSGSGKTTITRLLARFWDVQSGQITVDGQDIRMIEPDLLLEHISMVFQEVYLFADTIYNNIALARPEATHEQVMEASQLANCHDFIVAMPDGYDTPVQEGGSTLSGGEKQRISIARALLKNAPILMLDEATASLDPENEWFIQQALEPLLRNKTVIVIAHRLHTIMQADQIIVMKEGRVEECGTHTHLLLKEGAYAKLWDIQQRANGWIIEN
jgi:ATP-binding cassette subfamily B protein IrtB